MKTNNKTLSDYIVEVQKAKTEYQNLKTRNDWEYGIIEERHPSIIFFMIGNKYQATKIIFDYDTKYIVNKTIYRADMQAYNTILEKL